jgi:hypothetical protein
MAGIEAARACRRDYLVAPRILWPGPIAQVVEVPTVMKRFLITYTRRPETGSPEDWHQQIVAFIASLDADPLLRGRINYSCMKKRDGLDYVHLAEVLDDDAGQALQQRAFFQSYSAAVRHTAGGVVEATPLDLIAETTAARD